MILYYFVRTNTQSIEILKSYNIVPEDEINDDQADAFCILLYVESQENK